MEEKHVMRIGSQRVSAHMDVEMAVGSLVEDAGVPLHRPLVQAERHLWEGV